MDRRRIRSREVQPHGRDEGDAEGLVRRIGTIFGDADGRDRRRRLIRYRYLRDAMMLEFASPRMCVPTETELHLGWNWLGVRAVRCGDVLGIATKK